MVRAVDTDGKIRVVITDDSPFVRREIRAYLHTQPQIEVIGEAADGQAAVKMAQEREPDVILMDVNMPRMNGIEVTRRIHTALPEVKIIGLSMAGDVEVQQAMMAAGATEFVAKAEAPEAFVLAILRSRFGR